LSQQLEVKGRGGFAGRPFFVLVFRYRARVGWGSYGAPHDANRFCSSEPLLLISGQALAALIVAWDSFIDYEFFRFFELVL
jgi:hypothetical protein